MQDMTQGSLFKHLITYAIPMIMGNIMQLTYNAVDSVIIGKYLGENALAAVSTSNPIMTIMILGASGIGIGSSVIISRLFGSGDLKNLKKEFATTLIFGIFFSLIIFLAGISCSEMMLRAINTPIDILPDATLYLRIIFIGFLCTFQYNIVSNALRGIGDSKTPVYFLGISCIINVALDLLFVAVLGFGVAGAGLATVFAEAISVVCCLLYIYHKVPILHLKYSDLKIDTTLLKQTLQIGSLTALQQAAQPIGKVLIQSCINAQGIIAIGAFNAVCRIDDFACIPAQSIGSGIMTCTAQNRGAGKWDRVRSGFRCGFFIALGYYPIICIASLLLARPVISLLVPDNSYEMLAMGLSYMHVKAWIFILACINNAAQGFFRGMAKMHIVLISTCIQISLRTIFVFLLVPVIGIKGEAFACLIGWSVQAVWEFGYYFIKIRKCFKDRFKN